MEKSKLIDSAKVYTLAEGLALVKKTSSVKFDASVEFHAVLGIDTASGDQQVRASVSLPHGTGKTKRIAVFATGDDLKAAQEAGADKCGGKELIDEIKAQKKLDGIDVVVATPAMMPLLAPVAKILGPRGLMPSPKTETVTTKIKEVVAQLKKGKVEFRNDTGANLHQVIGKVGGKKLLIKGLIDSPLEVLKNTWRNAIGRRMKN